MARKPKPAPITAAAAIVAAPAAAGSEAAAAEAAAAEAAAAEAAAKGEGKLNLDGRMLHIRSVDKAGRRRAGIAFTPEAIEVDPATLSDDQVAQLLSDPQLVVELD